MAKVFITEYERMGHDASGVGVAACQEPAVAHKTVTAGGVSAQSGEFDERTQVIRVHTDDIVSIEIGENPTADANKCRLAAGQTEYFSVKGGHKLAAIQNT